MRPVDSHLRDLHGGLEAERLVDVVDVVVDRLGNSHDRDVQAASLDFLVDGMCALESSVAADRK